VSRRLLAAAARPRDPPRPPAQPAARANRRRSPDSRVVAVGCAIL